MKIRSLIFLILMCSSLLAGLSTSDNYRLGIEGTWLPSTAELGGRVFPDEVRKSITLVVKNSRYTVTVGKAVDKGIIKLNTSASPNQLDITGTDGPIKGRTILGIYERKGDTLRICYDLSGKGCPSEFKTAEGTQLFLVTYKLQ